LRSGGGDTYLGYSRKPIVQRLELLDRRVIEVAFTKSLRRVVPG
jgi:hypothetical protein